MGKHKGKFIAVAAVLLILAGAWFWGGPAEIVQPTADITQPITEITPTVVEQPIPSPTVAPATLPAESAEETTKVIEAEDEDEEIEEIEAAIDTEEAKQQEDYIASQAQPEEQVEEQAIASDSFFVTISVRVNTLLYNIDLLHRDKHELVPDGGWIFYPTQVEAFDGESVFNVLQREMRRHGIHMASRWTPIFNSAYVEAINNLYEFDAGPLSGWMYSVNSVFPNYGSSRYILSNGDVVEWLFTVDLGRDLGADWEGRQEDE